MSKLRKRSKFGRGVQKILLVISFTIGVVGVFIGLGTATIGEHLLSGLICLVVAIPVGLPGFKAAKRFFAEPEVEPTPTTTPDPAP